MDSTSSKDTSTDWAYFIRETFFKTWEISTPVDLTDYAFLFDRHFDLIKINGQLTKIVAEAHDAEKVERYHKNRIRTLSHIFTEALLEISDDGKHITSKNIEKAKIILQNDSRCVYE